jgi:hypothetical protein
LRLRLPPTRLFAKLPGGHPQTLQRVQVVGRLRAVARQREPKKRTNEQT